MMRNIFLFWIVCLTGSTVLAQGALQILPGTQMTMVDTSHLVLVHLNLKNNGTFTPAQSTVHFTGAGNDSLLGSANTAFYNLTIDKGVGANFFIPPELPIDGPWYIRHDLVLGGSDTRVMLSIRDLILGPKAKILGASPNRFIVTPGSGRVVKDSLTDFTFPVGSDQNSYTPLRKIYVFGGNEKTAVRCLPHVLANGSSGNQFTSGVADVSWEVSQSQANPSTFSIIAQWNGTDELSGFDGNDCGVSFSLGNGDWDLAGANIGQKSGQGPFTMTRSGITLGQNLTGVFAVGSEPVMYPLRAGPKTFLQGAYNANAGNMNDNLRALQLIPLLEPYTQTPGFTHVGRGGGETVSPNVLGISGSNAIVDWVFLELRSALNSSMVLETRSALIQRDGDVVDVDGTSPVIFRGREADDYFIAVRHRNHIGIRSTNTLSLANQPVQYYNFTVEQFQAIGGVQAPLANGQVWGMYGGNANSNNNVKYSGPGNDQNTLLNGCLGGNKSLILSQLYNSCDLNLNGTVRYSGPLNDQNFLLNTVLEGSKAKIITQPNF